MTFAVTAKGQVTIPKGVRHKLGIRPGTRLAFAAENGRLVATKVDTPDRFTKWRGRGRLPGKLDVDAYLSKIRDGHRG
jgi:AbrB family looped-hinge helix DNA binding protein